MKIRIAQLLILTASLTLFSCGGNAESQADHEHANGQDHEHSEVSMDESEIRPSIKEPELKLNNGEKWEANPETTQGIANMKMTLEEYASQPVTTRGYYPGLAQKLIAEFSDIFQNCTMKGDAHDQLHRYLLPMKPYLEKIGSGDTKDAEQATAELTKYLNYYDSYFK